MRNARTTSGHRRSHRLREDALAHAKWLQNRGCATLRLPRSLGTCVSPGKTPGKRHPASSALPFLSRKRNFAATLRVPEPLSRGRRVTQPKFCSHPARASTAAVGVASHNRKIAVDPPLQPARSPKPTLAAKPSRQPSNSRSCSATERFSTLLARFFYPASRARG